MFHCSICRRISALARHFAAQGSGQIAILFGLSMTVIVMAAGGGIDLARAYQARQKLSEVATLACQYASRNSIIKAISPTYPGTDGQALFKTNVTSFISNTLVTQQFGWQQTNANPFTFTVSGPADVNLTANVPTAFMQIVRISQLPVAATSHCYDNPPGIAPTVPGPSVFIQEGFETTGGGYTFIKPDGTIGTISTPTSATPASPSYTGSSGQGWSVLGYCLEIDSTGVINTTSPEGSHTAELDCDNGSGSAGNSSITTRKYFPAGAYELRYFYRSRVSYPNYDPVYICGSTASDVSWANDTTSFSSPSLRTNQINVYFDIATTSTIPLHTTIGSSQQLAGSNLIDVCVYSPTWIERSVKITVTTPAYYYLSFAADGASDSYGGQIDNIRVCQQTCPNTAPNALMDNFPTSWLAANNGGVNKILFEDSFESPSYTADFSNWINKSGNLNTSNGTTVTTGCVVNGFNSRYPSLPGWPCQVTNGWATGPVNQVNVILQGAANGSQYVSLDGYNSNGDAATNRFISRQFLLVPGYYQVSYRYISDVDFSSSGYGGNLCYAKPASGALFMLPDSYANATGSIRFYQTLTTRLTTNLIGVFMANGTLTSTPIGGGALGSTTSFNDPDPAVAPARAPDSVNYASYSASAVNPLLDVCNYSSSFAWLTRTTNIKIQKTGLYWLTFSARGGKEDGNGGGIDDVILTALGSLYMTAPTSPLTIPVSDPQPDTAYSGPGGSYNGFSIVADPLTPSMGP